MPWTLCSLPLSCKRFKVFQHHGKAGEFRTDHHRPLDRCWGCGVRGERWEEDKIGWILAGKHSLGLSIVRGGN